MTWLRATLRTSRMDRYPAASRWSTTSGGAPLAGQFDLLDWNEFYFPDGRFEEARTVARWTSVLEGAVENGYPCTRVVAHLEWSRDDVNTVLEYEANFNRT